MSSRFRIDWISPWIRFVAAFIVVLNLPFWIAARYLDTAPRGWINIEYILIGAVSSVLRRWISWTLLVSALIVDLIHVSTSFYFFTQHDFVHSIRYVVTLPASRFGGNAAILFGIAGALAWISLILSPSKLPVSRRSFAATFVLIAVLLAGADVLGGTNAIFQPRNSGSSRVNLAGAPTVAILKMTEEIVFRNKSEHDFHSVDSAIKRTLSTLDHSPRVSQPLVNSSTPKHNLVLVLVESFGQFRDARYQELLLKTFTTSVIAERYDLESGAVPFTGATLSGEFRELCGLWAGVLEHPDAVLLKRNCLSNRLREAGYETTALHGLTGYMFDRVNLYPELGFTHSIFREQLSDQSRFHDCRGAFTGICDSDIAGLIREKLVDTDSTKPQFIYWVTLDSHLPVPRSRLPLPCGEGEALIRSADICDWMAVLQNTLAQIAGVATAPDITPTEFVIVGDHAPPFLLTSLRQQFSGTVVPYIHLLPKTTSIATTQVKAQPRHSSTSEP